MPDYSVFILDANGHICRAVGVAGATDADALEAAALAIPAGRTAEVWLYDRMIGTVRRHAAVMDKSCDA